MLSFKQYLLYEKVGYPVWVKGASLLLSSKMKALTVKIKNQKNLELKLDLIAQQNDLLAYMGSLGIAVDMNDRSIAKLV